MDEHIHRAITVGLRQRGVDVLTVQEDGRTGDPDWQVLDRATELGRCLFTQDEDFLTEADKRLAEGRNFGGVIYAHRLKISIGTAVRDLRLIAESSDFDHQANRVEYLPF